VSKVSGLGAAIIIDDASGTPQTITNDITEFSLETPRGVEVITGVDKSADERLLLLADASVSLKGVANFAANMSHAVFSSVTNTSVNRTTKVTPSSASVPYISMEMLYDNYPLTRAANGALTWSVKGMLADGTVPAWTNS
jgi:hypothetical protein